MHGLRRDGVSRLSAYHHYGMVSPFKVARDALLARSNGAEKYLDEFFTWREVAHAFCFRSWPALETVQVCCPGLARRLRLVQLTALSRAGHAV
jgi:deoxyribodipyrimidine photolyase